MEVLPGNYKVPLKDITPTSRWFPLLWYQLCWEGLL